MKKKQQARTRTSVKYGKVRQSLVDSAQGAQPNGRKAGRAVRGAATVAAATVVAGVGSVAGAVYGFAKGLWS